MGESADAAAYVAALCLPASPVAGVASWAQAAAISQRQDWSRAWWQGESDAGQELLHRAALAFGKEAVAQALSEVTAAADALHGAAALAMGRAGLADPALSRVAAGAAAQACHQRALAIAAAVGPEHVFAIKYRLFAGGRWPLGVVGDRFFVF